MKKGLVLFFWVTCAFGKPVVYDVTRLQVDDARFALDGTAQVSTRVLFEDLMPGANWEHPARYRVVDKNGQTLKIIPTNRAPKNLATFPQIDGDDFTLGDRVQFKLNDFKGELKVKEPGRFYAILINGEADQRHWNDFSFLFRVLTQLYGYDKAQIFVADSAFKDRQPDLDGDGQPDILYASTMDGVRDLMKLVAERMKKDDQLLLAVNDHGSTLNGESTIVLHDGDLKASEFSALMAKMPSRRVLSIFEQCFSGGFVRPVVTGERVAMAAATNLEYSWASMDLNFDEFIYGVIAAFAKQTHDGRAVNANTDEDPRISAQEAFAFAAARDARPESPFLESATNAGGSRRIGVGY